MYTRTNYSAPVVHIARTTFEDITTKDILADQVITNLSPSESLALRLRTTPALRHVAAATTDAVDLGPLRTSAAGLPLIIDGVTVPVGQDVLLLHELPTPDEVVQVVKGAPYPAWTTAEGDVLIVVDGGNTYGKSVFLWNQGQAIQLTATVGREISTSSTILASETGTETGATTLIGPNNSKVPDQLRVRYLVPGPGIALQSVSDGKGVTIALAGGAECTHTTVRVTDVVLTAGGISMGTAPLLTSPPIPVLRYPATTAGAAHSGSIKFILAGIPAPPTTFDLEGSVFQPSSSEALIRQPEAFTFALTLTFQSSGTVYRGSLVLPANTLDSGRSSRITCTWTNSPPGFALTGIRMIGTRPLLPAEAPGADLVTLELSSTGAVPLPSPLAFLGLRFVWWPAP